LRSTICLRASSNYYTVIETNLAGYSDVSDSKGGNASVVSVTVGIGVSMIGITFVDEIASAAPSISASPIFGLVPSSAPSRITLEPTVILEYNLRRLFSHVVMLLLLTLRFTVMALAHLQVLMLLVNGVSLTV
jgi:hypothetical protein